AVSSSPALGSDGTLYVGSGDHSLYALGAKLTNAAPTLSAGSVTPENGNTQTPFIFSVTYADSDNDEPAAIALKIDTNPPLALSKRQHGDNTYVTGVVYEYRTGLSEGRHQFSFAASDGALSARGDTTSHTGPQVAPGPPLTLADSPWPMAGHDVRHTGQSPYRGPDKARLKWKFPTGGGVTSSPALGNDGTVYVGSADHYVYALSAAGALKWKFLTGNSVSSSPALGSDGTVYVGSNDSSLYALSTAGSLKWKFKAGGGVFSSPALGSDGTVYVGSRDGSVYALSAAGSLKWKFKTGGGVSSSPALGSDGTLYVGSGDHSLYALEASPTGSSLSSGGEKDAEFDEHGAPVFGLSSNLPNPF
ncbi:MAG: PQQ-binding-like beta-propeller repeat protein, partial [Chloroflexi bacterium]|nr:PQQ-binding-like beta-propeller repeat protein [Chloroflexota bacterium]